ncbi:MAG TPA: UpxY family transcription antiterminator [Bryobacteraceae bacterium]|nr:UpxY family transcription antiterminator [Bryobacteraceae bacterium]
MADLSPFPVTAAHRWFALQVRARSEKLSSDLLAEKEFETFLPTYLGRRRWSDRFKTVDLPLFPGYVFCRCDPRERLPILKTPSVIQFVGIGKVPLPVDDSELAAVRTIIESGIATKPWPFLKVGARVRIGEGPLTGLEGILVSEKDRNRLIVSVTLLQRSVATQIDRCQIRPL